jgi:cysteine synthase
MWNQSNHMTPMREIHFGRGLVAVAKMEAENPSGSHKDRAIGIKIRSLLETGQIGNGPQTIIMSSSGRAAISGAEYTAGIPGVKFVVISDKLSPEALIRPLRNFAHVELIVVDKPDSTGSHLSERLAVLESLKLANPGAIILDQYSDEILPLAYRDSLVSEIENQIGLDSAVIFIPVGTCALLKAICDRKREKRGRRWIVQPVDAEGSRLFHDCPGKRYFSGYGNAKPTPFAQRAWSFAAPIWVKDIEVARMARWLLTGANLKVGPSSAATAAGFVKVAWNSDRVPHDAIAVLIFPDYGDAYDDTIFNDEWLMDHGLGKAISAP